MSAENTDPPPDLLRDILGLLGQIASSADPALLARLSRLTSSLSQISDLRSGVEGLRADIRRIEHNTAETVRLLTELRDLSASRAGTPPSEPPSDGGST